MPGNATEAAEQVAGIVKADRVVKRSSLQPGDYLAPNAVLSSASGSAWLHNQLDGNIVLINPQLKPLWSTGTVDKSCAPQNCKDRLELTDTGELRLVAANGTVMWTPPGAGPVAHATQLIVQDDCNVVSKPSRL
jgi:DNA-binding beta-propeller fold protein YncE